MPLLNLLGTSALADRLRTRSGRRAVGIGLALLIEALLLLALLSLGGREQPGADTGGSITVVNIDPIPAPEPPSEPSSAEPAQPQQEQPPAEPQQPGEVAVAPPVAEPAPIPPPIVRVPATQPSAPPAAGPPRQPPRSKGVYGPPDRGSSYARDTERVGTAPNGEPLYAAAWYREPTDEQLRGYLSTASPGWGLIACRTVPDYRVEDCLPISEYPQGSQMNRAILAAAWEFRVRPPRLGGELQVGAWVRIRIDYTVSRR